MKWKIISLILIIIQIIFYTINVVYISSLFAIPGIVILAFCNIFGAYVVLSLAVMAVLLLFKKAQRSKQLLYSTLITMLLFAVFIFYMTGGFACSLPVLVPETGYCLLTIILGTISNNKGLKDQ